MSKSLYLLRMLREDRSFFYRVGAFFGFVSLLCYTTLVLHFHEQGQLRFLEVINLVAGFGIACIFVAGAIDLSKRNQRFKAINNEKKDLQTKFASSQELLFRIDNETREEMGAWLHGTLQPKLTSLAKDIRTQKEIDLEVIARRVDEISEKFVRTYSHSLYPPALMVSLEVGLETLLEGRAELKLDERLTNAASVGFAIWSPNLGIPDNSRDLRLHLGGEYAYAAFRIVEEAVANAEKKPNTSAISVCVSIVGNALHISVRDNGDPIPESINLGLGLSVINSFMQNFGGTMSIENVAGGVELVASLPYQHQTVADMLLKRFQGEA